MLQSASSPDIKHLNQATGQQSLPYLSGQSIAIHFWKAR
jgi:hypothetical protein